MYRNVAQSNARVFLVAAAGEGDLRLGKTEFQLAGAEDQAARDLTVKTFAQPSSRISFPPHCQAEKPRPVLDKKEVGTHEDDWMQVFTYPAYGSSN